MKNSLKSGISEFSGKSPKINKSTKNGKVKNLNFSGKSPKINKFTKNCELSLISFFREISKNQQIHQKVFAVIFWPRFSFFFQFTRSVDLSLELFHNKKKFFRKSRTRVHSNCNSVCGYTKEFEKVLTNNMAGENGDSQVIDGVSQLSVTAGASGEAAPSAAERSLLQKVIRKGLIENKNDLEIQRKDPNSPLYSVKSFEALNLKPALLKGITATISCFY